MGFPATGAEMVENAENQESKPLDAQVNELREQVQRLEDRVGVLQAKIEENSDGEG